MNKFVKTMKKKSLALKILRGVGITGLFLISMTNPYFGIQLLTGFKKVDKRDRRRFYRSLSYLEDRGYVRASKEENGSIAVKMLKDGKKLLEKADIDSMELKDKTIDGKWRIVIFDIPVQKSRNRRAFTERLKLLGFVMVQKSVWVCPYKCRKEIAILRKFYEVDRYVTYLESDEIENEHIWKRRFNESSIC